MLKTHEKVRKFQFKKITKSKEKKLQLMKTPF